MDFFFTEKFSLAIYSRPPRPRCCACKSKEPCLHPFFTSYLQHTNQDAGNREAERRMHVLAGWTSSYLSKWMAPSESGFQANLTDFSTSSFRRQAQSLGPSLCNFISIIPPFQYSPSLSLSSCVSPYSYPLTLNSSPKACIFFISCYAEIE